MSARPWRVECSPRRKERWGSSSVLGCYSDLERAKKAVREWAPVALHMRYRIVNRDTAEVISL